MWFLYDIPTNPFKNHSSSTLLFYDCQHDENATTATIYEHKYTACYGKTILQELLAFVFLQ
jgi:hypothetical protein